MLHRNNIFYKKCCAYATFFSQIAGVKDSYIFADDWDMPDGAKLPIWMLGFLYLKKGIR